MKPRIGVAVTTRNRWDVAGETVDAVLARTPRGTPVVVVNDAGDDPPSDWYQWPEIEFYRFNENVGIARAKNKGLELLEQQGVEHFFLFDDDAYPLVDDWWEPYVDSPEPHLMRIFPDLAGPNKLNDVKEIYRGHGHVAYTSPRGVMLYAHRSVLDAVGGMDPGFGLWGYEHGDWSNRIYSAGLTTWRFADVDQGAELIYSLDEHEAVDRSVEGFRRAEQVRLNKPRYDAQYNTTTFHNFREEIDVVLSCVYTKGRDNQRPDAVPLTTAAVGTLAASLAGHELRVFTDEPDPVELADVKHRWVHTQLGVENLYFQRWYDYWRWLRDHPEVRYVWCVDGTDVEMLNEPGPYELGKIYLGSEPGRIGDGWLRRNHPIASVQKLVRDQPDRTLLNAGLVGGEREVVMEFLHDLIRAHQDSLIDHFHAQGDHAGVGDMGLFNVVARLPKWDERRVFGSLINTEFKAYARSDASWWRHK